MDLEYALNLLRSVKPPCYGYLWQHYVLGWDHAEIANAYGISYGAARMQVNRCLKLAQSLVKKKE
jgi:DNA-directed RNA polymerase specialized sigma24 family protein